ncbi:hypothetical protein F5Y16DRAFT_191997 [Xylariaceae sp. FL0255]|nr:hypothetical protein F5Y16DRAFT_191997 [Xylariaceae sp. FL0255]
MRVHSVLPFFALGAVAESNHVTRDATTITKLLSDIFYSMTNADTQLLAYHGGPPFALREACEALYYTIASGTPVSAKMDPLTGGDAKAITEISQKVTFAGTKLLEDIIQAVPVFEKTGLCEHLYQYSVWLGKVSDEFFTTTKGKFPEEHQATAQQEITGTETLFAKVQAALAPGACVNEAEPPKFCDKEPWKGQDGDHKGEGDEPKPSAPAPAPTKGAGGNSSAPHNGNSHPVEKSGTEALRYPVSALVLLMINTFFF